MSNKIELVLRRRSRCTLYVHKTNSISIQKNETEHFDLHFFKFNQNSWANNREIQGIANLVHCLELILSIIDFVCRHRRRRCCCYCCCYCYCCSYNHVHEHIARTFMTFFVYRDYGVWYRSEISTQKVNRNVAKNHFHKREF